ncbi:MAG: hypothetical protein QW112_03960, partial [Candidatus Micrarchaeia archaeon]
MRIGKMRGVACPLRWILADDERGLNQSGTWSGTDTVGMACSKDGYRVVGGSTNIPIEVKA